MIQCVSTQVTETATFNWRLSAKSSPEVPRFIIVGFQTNNNNRQEANPALFDNVNFKSINVSLNSVKYPKTDYRISFTRNQFSRVYGDAALFRSKFFNMSELVSNPNFTPAEYKDLYTLFLFDVSKQTDRLQYSTTDIQIEVNFIPNEPANTVGLLSDRLAHFQFF